MTPTTQNGPKADVPITKTIMDLDTMTEVTLVKPTTFAPVATTAEALARLGNDASRFLDIVNEGLRAEERRQLAGLPGGWFNPDEEDSTKPGEPFAGTIADAKAVNAMVLNMAKYMFGYLQTDGMTKDDANAHRAAAKAKAMDLIKTTPVMRDGLKASAALKVEAAS